jgi:putative glutamine amidotransferase
VKPYVEAIRAHGADVLVLRPGDRPGLVSLHGLVLAGGGDFSRCAYGARALSMAERRSLRGIDPKREAFERRLLRWAHRADIPTLGICRGFQMLNVFAGGTLVPDIGTAHQVQARGREPLHDILLEHGSRLRAILGGRKRIRVNSRHHQAIGRGGRRMRVSARSLDGVVEGLEDPSRTFWIGVQFHPERMWRRAPLLSRLFKRLVARSRKHGRCPE